MMYAHGFVATVVGPEGKPLREHNEDGKRITRIPFDSEYKIRIKNKSSNRCYANVEIDGTNVISAGKLLLQPGQFVELERFVDSLASGRKFKFVRPGHPDVQDPTSGENGRIRVTFEPEWVKPTVTYTTAHGGAVSQTKAWDGSGLLRGLLPNPSIEPGFNGVFSCNAAPNTSMPIGCDLPGPLPCAVDLGATVEGGLSTQAFTQACETFETLMPVIIDIWVRGPAVDQPARWIVRVRYGGVPELWRGTAYISRLSKMDVDGNRAHLVSECGRMTWDFADNWELQSA